MTSTAAMPGYTLALDTDTNKHTIQPKAPPTSVLGRLWSKRSNSISASPDSPASANSHFDHSITRSTRSASTAATSIEAPFSPGASCSQDPDDWFARFRNDPDLALNISDDCPTAQTLDLVSDVPLFDATGNSRTFGSLIDPNTSTHPRQLFLFVRHFYCGACQAYLQALTEGIAMSDYFSVPTPTSIIIIGCGSPDLIPNYRRYSGNCPWPIFADPSRQLFKKLGMVLSLDIGRKRPEYMKDITPASWAKGQVTTIKDGLKEDDPAKGALRKRDLLRGGNLLQIGGEFLVEDGRVVWCHRMRNYRDHTEIRDLRRLLELDG